MTIKDLTIFINSSDGFEDCWTPFFTLWSKYAPSILHYRVLLNTENKYFLFEGLNITSTRVSAENRCKLTWSECLNEGLNKVATPYVLYLQEDYFLKNIIEADVIRRALQHLNEFNLDVVYLNHWGPQWKNAPSNENNFVDIPSNSKYLLSTQAAIWRLETLRSLIRPWENGWSYEKFGTIRMRHKGVGAVQYGGNAVDYIYTGIIKGRWLPECIDLFNQEKIDVDFSRRGFYREAGRLKTRYEVVRKLIENPISFFRSCLSLAKS